MAVKGWRGLVCFPAGVGSWLLGAVGLGRYRWGKACEYSFGVVVYPCQSVENKKGLP